VEPDALPAWAEKHAASWLADRGWGWQHVCGVAQQAQRVSQALAEVDRPYLVAAAWLHDIGYASALAATVFHPLDGARHVRALGQERLARLVAYHSSARWEAEALGLAGELATFSREDSPTADALTYCDMTTSPIGQPVTLGDRLAEIAERYGAEHLVVQCLQRAHDHLAGAVERTEARMWAAGVGD
jgi:HD domain